MTASPQAESELDVEKHFPDRLDSESHARYVPAGADHAPAKKSPRN